MKIRQTSLLTVAALCAAAIAGCGHDRATAPPQNNSAVQAAIQAAYDRQSAAYVARDASAVMVECSPNYTELNGQETDSRAQVTQTIEDFVALAATLKATAAVESVDVDGQLAHVIVNRHFDLLSFPMKKKTESTAHQHRFVSDETNRDTWTTTDGKRWLKLDSAVLASSSSIDGKPDDH